MKNRYVKRADVNNELLILEQSEHRYAYDKVGDWLMI